ncbi:3960_t:CDS:2 [Funneliformis geosporum]|nr:3960_t:CDS:2 [Funneliformis geosporum]
MLYWIENVWIKRARLSNPQSLLVLDSFSARLVNSVKRHFDQSNGRIEIDNVDQKEGNVDDYYDVQETNHVNVWDD